MLVGRSTFRGDTLTDTLAAVMRAEPDWSRVPSEVPEALRELMRRCLRKDPRQRLQAIGDARIALEETLSAGVPLATPSGQDSGSTQVLTTASARKRRARTAWIVGGGVAMLAAVALASAFYIASRRVESAPLHLSMTLPDGWNLA